MGDPWRLVRDKKIPARGQAGTVSVLSFSGRMSHLTQIHLQKLAP